MSGISSSKSAILVAIKRRLGFAILVAVVAVATAVVSGNSLIAVVAVVVAGMVLIAVAGSRSSSSPPGAGPKGRTWGGPLMNSYCWAGTGQLDLTDLRRRLEAEGLSMTSEDRAHGKVVLKGGSQLRMRLLGGYFIDPKQLPILAELQGSSVSAQELTLLLNVRDRFGVALRDDGLGEQFGQAAKHIKEVVESHLSTMGDFTTVPDSIPRD